MDAIKDYDVRLDAKGRVTLRGATYKNYNVKLYENGCFILEPRELVIPEVISARSLAEMDKAVENFKTGNVSASIDLSDFD
ncbi:MAG: hypothetical protein ACLRPN_12665 [Blautia massiliensis (ex Durand et al. 2017)]|jgi:hypothetical protein|uniref:hypothetical protein n=1 Tax=Blautia massiliensis (ex Durand et al. 2017) TaxID=1737424 RepID=UPI003990D17E